jgi:tetratricopeptide (TPR) repeat protein
MDEIEISNAVSAAQSAHASGCFEEAESIYRAILASSPQHAGALHGLALLAAQSGDFQRAGRMLMDALGHEPRQVEWFYQLGLVQLQQRNLSDAAAALQQVVTLEPEFPDAHNTLGVVMKQQGDVQAAIECYRHALTLNPTFPEAANNLGVALKELGRHDEAIEAFSRALAGRPDYPEALSNLADVLRATSRTDQAIQALRRAADLRPDSPEIHYNLGFALQDDGRGDEAIAAYRKALALRPDYAEALNNLGNVLHEQGEFEEAIAAYESAIALRPDVADVHNNLGRALKEVGRLDDAIAAYQCAIELRADLKDAQNNLGNALVAKGDTDAAIRAYERAVESDAGPLAARPDRELDATWNYALALLLFGDFERGWELYEVRNRKKASMLRPDLANKLWDGTDLAGRRILLLGEQGLGDTIHFFRYASMVARRGGKIILHCQPPLRPLLERQTGIDEVVVEGQPLPDFDVCCPLMSLPHIFKTTSDSIPATVPYILPDPDRVSRWADRLAELTDVRPRVGLVWAGNPGYGNDRNRSIPFSTMAPLANVKGVTFVSLQKGTSSRDSQNAPPGMHLINLTDQLTDFAETAALVANLDLVIAVDTAVTHLAGAIAKPTWTLLPFAPDWRWQLARPDSPWYPTMRLFRQTTRAHWDPVIQKVKELLSELDSNTHPQLTQ